MCSRWSVSTVVILCTFVFSTAGDPDVKLTPSGFAYYQIGQIMQMTPNDGSLLEKAFDQHFNGRLTLNATIKEQLKIGVGVEFEYGANLNDFKRRTLYMLKEAYGTYSFGNPAMSFLQITTGYFPFKYNPQAMNLGEYLFRSGAYPPYVITDFDFAKVRLMGFNVASTLTDELFNVTSLLFNELKLNLLFTSEYGEPPYFDYSLSFVAGYKFLKRMIDIGAGVDFNRLLPIDPDETTFPSNYVTDLDNEYVIQDNGDTLLYTKQGVKCMGRFTLDIKPVLPFAEIFGPEDGKIYGELAVLGVKNFGSYYPEIKNRMPMMLGFNIPCFNIIDLISFEFEYYQIDSSMVYDRPAESTSPFPKVYTGSTRTFYKWSFFGQKTIVKGLAIKGLIGRDHYRSMTSTAGGTYDNVERMNGPGDWHYKLRIMYSF
ncbi:MAG: hypothetical protein JXA18_06010 [Chitinispirillaceae bacterium]|nr:hypothetical protein [Chitinispirillaceae bacterium]